jgi:hypothetical protein
LDGDDKDTINALAKAELDSRVVFNIQPREDTIAQKWNRAIKEEADVYLVAADDDPYITPGYDERVLSAASLFPDGIGMVYGHLANASFTCAVGCTRKWVDQLGYIFPEYFPYWFVDHWTDDLAKITGRISLADIRTDQSTVGKTQEMREPGWWATFFDAGYMVRRKEAFGILDKLDEPEWRKDMQRNQAPIIEYRSRWINDGVRSRSQELTEWSGLDASDERYLRVRDKAVAMIPELVAGMSKEEAEKFKKVLLVPLIADAAWAHDEPRLKAALGQWL